MDTAPERSPLQSDKTLQIQTACKRLDIAALLDYAISPLGFVNDDCRRLAWPILLGSDSDVLSTWEKVTPAGETPLNSPLWMQLPRHPDERQASLDVERSFVYYPKDDGKEKLAARKGDLGLIITQTLRQYPYLCYFQGYHDIVQVLLLVLGRDMAAGAVARLSILRIRDFMLPSLTAATAHLALLPHLLRAVEPELEQRLSQTPPFFALAATLTLYAHEIETYGDIARLFDFFLAQPASVPIYFFAQVVMNRKKELLEVEEDEPEMLHSILSKLPTPLDLEGLIMQTMRLYSSCPPQQLPGNPWRNIDRNSVLKTTVNMAEIRQQTLRQGEVWFHRQGRKLQRDQTVQSMISVLRAYRRPAQSASLAVVVVAIAWWIGRDPAAWMTATSALRRCRIFCGL